MARIAWFNCTQVPPGRVVSTEEKERLLTDNNSTSSDLIASNGLTSSSPNKENETKLSNEGLMNFSLLFTNSMWKTTIMLVLLWMGIGWLYFGVILLTTSLLQYDAHCSSDELTNMSNFTNESSSCVELDTSDYLEILWVSAAEIPGLLLTVVSLKSWDAR